MTKKKQKSAPTEKSEMAFAIELARGASVLQAAKKIRIAESTGYRWSRKPEVRPHEYSEVAEIFAVSLAGVEPRRGTGRRGLLRVAERLRSKKRVDVSRVVRAVHGESAEPRLPQEQLFGLISDAAASKRPVLIEAPTGTAVLRQLRELLRHVGRPEQPALEAFA